MYQGKKLGRRELVCHDSAHDANKHTKRKKKRTQKKLVSYTHTTETSQIYDYYVQVDLQQIKACQKHTNS